MPTGGMFLLTFLVFATLEPVGIKDGGAGVGQHPPGNRSRPFAIPADIISYVRSEMRDPWSVTEVRDP